MTISERTLRKWRKEALHLDNLVVKDQAATITITRYVAVDTCQKLLKMTQELLDQHLLKTKITKKRQARKETLNGKNQ